MGVTGMKSRGLALGRVFAEELRFLANHRVRLGDCVPPSPLDGLLVSFPFYDSWLSNHSY